MPRFFFNVRDGHDIPDEEGLVLPDWGAARVEAIRFAGQLVIDNAKHIEVGDDWCLEVADEDGSVLFRLNFSVSERRPKAPDPS